MFYLYSVSKKFHTFHSSNKLLYQSQDICKSSAISLESLKVFLYTQDDFFITVGQKFFETKNHSCRCLENFFYSILKIIIAEIETPSVKSLQISNSKLYTLLSFNDAADRDATETFLEPAVAGSCQVFGKNTKSTVFPAIHN